MSELELKSPLAGWPGRSGDPRSGLRRAHDGRRPGDRPTGSILCAPCDGQVVSVHRAGHALTLRAANGVEILMHVGLETVALNGEGFERHVGDGQSVRAGDPLMSFDLDLLAQKARSLVTPVVVANSEAFEIVRASRAARWPSAS